MRKQTDLAAMKQLARVFLMMDPEPTSFSPVIIKHPFTDSGIVTTTLDRMGRNFGVRRDGADDRFYRLMIKVKVTALLSGGDVDTIITATSVLFDIDPEQVEVVELFPAKCRVIMDEADIAPEYIAYAANTAPIIKRIMAAGVGKEIYFRTPVKTGGTVYAGATLLEDITLTIPPYTNSFATAGRFGIGVALFEEITMQIKTKED